MPYTLMRERRTERERLPALPALMSPAVLLSRFHQSIQLIVILFGRNRFSRKRLRAWYIENLYLTCLLVTIEFGRSAGSTRLHALLITAARGAVSLLYPRPWVTLAWSPRVREADSIRPPRVGFPLASS